MRLYLAQHAEALDRDTDPERPLSEKGWEDARRVASFLKKSGVQVSRVVHSGKTRARQTAETLAEAVAPGKTAEVGARLDPNDDVEPVARWINEWDEDIIVVGHMPFMGKLVSLLVAGDEKLAIASFLPGSVVSLESSEGGGWSIAWMIRPETLPKD